MENGFSKCPSCGATIRKGQNECQYCHTSIIDDVQEVVIQEKNVQEKAHDNIKNYLDKTIRRKNIKKATLWILFDIFISLLFFVGPTTMTIFGFIKLLKEELSSLLFAVVFIVYVGIFTFGIFFSKRAFAYINKKIKILLRKN